MIKFEANNFLVFKKLVSVTNLFGELNYQLAKTQNPYILTYILEGIESISSNEIENIHTTVDEAGNDYVLENKNSPYFRYRETLKRAHKRMMNSEIIKASDIEWINKSIRGEKTGGFRKIPVKIIDKGTNKLLLEGINANEIPNQIVNLVDDINKRQALNPILRALLIHHRFEQIHPFNDGNGRTGRILFALLLTKYRVLKIPASIFSYSIVKHKEKYYRALKLADNEDYDHYLILMLEILKESLEVAINFVQRLGEAYLKTIEINEIKANPKLEKILKYCFYGVKVSIYFIARKTSFNQKTVIKYLEILSSFKILEKERYGKFTPYKNLVIEKIINNFLEMQ